MQRQSDTVNTLLSDQRTGLTARNSITTSIGRHRHLKTGDCDYTALIYCLRMRDIEHNGHVNQCQARPSDVDEIQRQKVAELNEAVKQLTASGR